MPSLAPCGRPALCRGGMTARDTDRPRAERHLNPAYERAVQVVIAENPLALLADSARADVELHVAAVAL